MLATQAPSLLQEATAASSGGEAATTGKHTRSQQTT